MDPGTLTAILGAVGGIIKPKEEQKQDNTLLYVLLGFFAVLIISLILFVTIRK
jgi:asparagine N-glycosylation enzyme membrane subunit Stt3